MGSPSGSVADTDVLSVVFVSGEEGLIESDDMMGGPLETVAVAVPVTDAESESVAVAVQEMVSPYCALVVLRSKVFEVPAGFPLMAHR